jgi:hypothetical protein
LTRQIDRRCGNRGVQPNILAEFDAIDAIVSRLQEVTAISVLPEHACHWQAYPGIKVIPLSGDRWYEAKFRQSTKHLGKDGGRRRSEYSKSDLRYWEDVVYRPTFGSPSNVQQSEFYVVRIGHEGQRTTFPLGTSNKKAAALKARDIYGAIVTNGWAAACAAFKKGMKRAARLPSASSCPRLASIWMSAKEPLAVMPALSAR